MYQSPYIRENTHRSQLTRRALLSLALLVSFVAGVAIFMFLYSSLIETNVESKEPKKVFAVAFSMAMCLSVIGVLYHLSNTRSTPPV